MKLVIKLKIVTLFLKIVCVILVWSIYAIPSTSYYFSIQSMLLSSLRNFTRE